MYVSMYLQKFTIVKSTLAVQVLGKYVCIHL